MHRSTPAQIPWLDSKERPAFFHLMIRELSLAESACQQTTGRRNAPGFAALAQTGEMQQDSPLPCADQPRCPTHSDGENL
jgi:hypothetical protein